MSDLKKIKGISIQSLDDNPHDIGVGDIWYRNNTDQVSSNLRLGITGAWVSGGAMGTARYALAGAGTHKSALAFGGRIENAYLCMRSCTESYNGTSWTAGGAMGTARYSLAGAGASNTAALAFGGQACSSGINGFGVGCTESYNGSSWTTGGVLSTARGGLEGVGTNTAALAFGGVQGKCFGGSNGFFVACNQSYNGSTWSAGGAMGTGRCGVGGAGTSTSALAFGGVSSETTYELTLTESYNGTSWTAGGALGTCRLQLAGAGGSNKSVLAFGGHKRLNLNNPPSVVSVSCVECYNGTAWTSTTAMNNYKSCLASSGVKAQALAFGGHDDFDALSTTELYRQVCELS